MKQTVLVLWIVLLAGAIFGSGRIASAANVVFWLLVAVHLAEFFAKQAVFRRDGGPMSRHLVQTLIYGMFHWKPLEEQQAAAGGDG
jgi:uncharacterized protein YhhL (DUF1145 family)